MLSKSTVKYIQSLGQKKFRDEEGVFVAEGTKIVKEFLGAKNVQVLEIYALKEWINENMTAVPDSPIHEITVHDLNRISGFTTPNQVLAIVKKILWDEMDDPRNAITLVLDKVQDPGNLGNIIRIADWFGVKNLVCSNDCADMYNPKVVQATMGSIARVNLVYYDLLNWLNDRQNCRMYASALEGLNVTAMNPVNEGIIIIGNESKGIRSEILQLANVKITIPRKGEAESLNAAAATAIILSHLVR